MHGTIKGNDRDGWYVEQSYPQDRDPVLLINRYKIIETEPARGNMGPAPQLEDGVATTYIRDSVFPHHRSPSGKACRWQIYKQGAYLNVYTDNRSEDVTRTPIPCPKVRKGIETRYYLGRWEKYSKREGWVRA